MRPTRLVLLLLILPLVTPAVEAQTKGAGDLSATDGSGDVSLGPQAPGGFPPGMPSSVVTDYLDITELKVYQETVDGIRISVSLKDLEKPAFTFSSHFVEILFGSQGSPPVSYSLRWQQVYFTTSGPTDDNSTPEMAPTFCFYAAPQQTGSCLRQRVVGWMDFETKSLVGFIPKASLLGSDPLSPEFQSPTPVSLGKGTRLSNFTVETYGDFWSDRLPDTGEAGPYILQEATANERLRIRLYQNETAEPMDPYAQYYAYAPQPTDFPEVPIEPGAPFPIALEIQNLNGAKRLINLTFEFLAANQAAKWQVRLAPSLQVPGNETRVVSLIVNATDTVKHRDSTLIRVVGRSVGFPDELGSQTLKLVASVPPNPSDDTLYFHAIRYQSGAPIDTCNDLGPFSGCSGGIYLNTVEDDPIATGDDVPASGSFSSIFSGTNGNFVQGSTTFQFTLEQALARDLVLDVNKDIIGEIQVGASQPFDGSLELQMRAGDLPIGGTSVAIAAADSQKPIPFTFLPLIDAARIPAGSLIGFQLRLSYSYVGTSAALIADPPGIIPKGSFVTLPIIPDPLGNNVTIGDNSLLSLTVKGDRDDFVNPGESRAFNVTLLNEGADTDNINITGYVDQGKCAIQIKPGQRFRLDGGDSARLGVLIRAHSEAKEGDRCQARVEAISETNPASRAVLLLEAIVTSGIDLEDDSENYTADAESAQKVQRDEPNGTPGAGFAASLLAALGVLVSRRRRGDA